MQTHDPRSTHQRYTLEHVARNTKAAKRNTLQNDNTRESTQTHATGRCEYKRVDTESPDLLVGISVKLV